MRMPKDDPNSLLAKQSTRRALLIGGLQAAGLTLIGARLYHLQVMQGRLFAPLADDNRISQRGLTPRRGNILDRGGLLLAYNEQRYRVSMLPGTVADMRESLTRLAKLIPLSPDEIETIVARARKSPRRHPVAVRSALRFEDIARVGLMLPHLPGVEIDTDMTRRYRDGHVAGHVVGYVGAVDRHALDDDPILRLPNARVGKAGIEQGMDLELRGEAGLQKFEVDARGRIVRNLEELAPSDGVDVMVTIESRLQARVIERLRNEARAALVALDVLSGEVVVMASVPTFDPNDLTADFDEARWNELQTNPHNPLLNRAIAGLYPPGSTFKMVTALAALEAGTITLDEQIACSGAFAFADQTYRCWRRDGHGRSDLKRALKESCDVYFYELAERTGIDRIATMARRLGLGQIYACGIGQQKAGLIPDTGWKRARLGKSWLRGETILAGIGQGYVLTTPLQLAVMTARLATGRAVVPTLVRRPGEPLPDTPLFPKLDVPDRWLEAIRSAMVDVVHEQGGTGGSADPDIDAVLIAGKTGTSQVRSSGGAGDNTGDIDWELRDHALFVSYFPALSPRYAVAAVVEHGGGGGATAAPIVRDVIRLLIETDPARRLAEAAVAADPLHARSPEEAP